MRYPWDIPFGGQETWLGVVNGALWGIGIIALYYIVRMLVA